MRKTTRTITTVIAAGTLTAFGLALAPAAMAAVPSTIASASSSPSTTETERGREGHGPRGERPGLETVMSVLDLTKDELKAARAAGTTLAELAEQQGVEVVDLIDALIADAEEHLTEHVAKGDLTQDEADARLAIIEQRITDRVNGVQPAGGDRPERGERGPGGHGPHGAQGAPADDNS